MEPSCYIKIKVKLYLIIIIRTIMIKHYYNNKAAKSVKRTYLMMQSSKMLQPIKLICELLLCHLLKIESKNVVSCPRSLFFSYCCLNLARLILAMLFLSTIREDKCAVSRVLVTSYWDVRWTGCWTWELTVCYHVISRWCFVMKSLFDFWMAMMWLLVSLAHC